MNYVFNTEVILKFYLGEDNALKVLDLFERVQNKKAKGYINIISLTEFYYIICKKSPEVAKEKVENLFSFGIVPVEINDDELWREAAKIKAVQDISLSDAFAAATAIRFNATLVAGKDSRFEGININMTRV